MTVVIERHSGPGNQAPASPSQDRFIRLGEVLRIHRSHLRWPAARPSREPLSSESCRIVRQRHIQQFHLRGDDGWLDYEDIRDAVESRRGGPSHNTKFREEIVLAPVKLLVAERDRPIRAALVYEPAYPARGKVLTLRLTEDGTRSVYGSWMMYAALAVLNSAVGQALYSEHVLQTTGRRASPDGLSRTSLAALPVAARSYSSEQLAVVASLAYQVSTLYEAQVDCGASFELQIDSLRERLSWEVCTLLRLEEGEARRLLSTARDLGLPGTPRDDGQLRIPGVAAPEIPPLPPIWLLTEEERARLAAGLSAVQGALFSVDNSETARLRLLARWEERVNAAPPAELRLEPPDDLPSTGSFLSGPVSGNGTDTGRAA